MNTRDGYLTTPAGDGGQGLEGDGGPAKSAGLEDSCAVTLSPSGNLFIADSDPDYGTVQMVPASTGTFYGQSMTKDDIYTVAGGGRGGDGGPADNASLAEPEGVALDAAGNLLIADLESYQVQLVAASTGTFYGQSMTAGDIYTVAGDGTPGYSGDGGPATSAELSGPEAVAVDGAGNLVIVDYDWIRVVAAKTGTFYGQSMTAGDIYTVAGNGNYGYSGDGGPALSAELAPAGVAVDGSGNLVIADTRNNRIRVVAASTGMFYGQSMTAGYIYTVAGDGTAGYAGDGGPATSAELNRPAGVTLDGSGNLVIADSWNGRLRVVAESTGTFYGQSMTAGDIYTVAGNGTSFSGDRGPATRAQLSGPQGVAVDAHGNTVIADAGNNRIRVVAASTGTFYGQSMTAGDIYTVAGTATGGYSGDGGKAVNAELSGPGGVAVDGAGNLVIADTGNNRIRVVAASTGTFYGRAMTAGHIYTVAGGGTSAGKGGLATRAALNKPEAVAVSGNGNLVIANGYIVKVVAESTGTFYGQPMTAGHIYGIAGGGKGSGNGIPGTKAELAFTYGVAADGSGNVLIADDSNEIRLVADRSGTYYGQAMKAGYIYDVAGNGSATACSSSGTSATGSTLFFADGVAVDGSGNLLIADSHMDTIQVVAASTGTFYGRSMTAGDIYTIAGTCNDGLSGDGGPATSAELDYPMAVTAGPSGSAVISDTGNNRVRVVSG